MLVVLVVGITFSKTAQPVNADGLEAKQLSIVADHSCVIANDNKIYCWGNGLFGCVGDGNVDSHVVATPISVQNGTAGFINDNVKAIAAGESHTCAIASDNKVYCWGGNAMNGALGNNNLLEDFSAVPVLVQNGTEGFENNNVKAIAAGESHTCAIASDNKVYCWGTVRYGALGNNSTSSIPIAVPVKVKDANGFTNSNVKAVAAGQRHTCAIDSNNKVYCWGSARYGTLGNGSASSIPIAVPVLVQDGTEGFENNNVKAIAAGQYHTCAIDSKNKIYCWGSGALGRLGNNNTLETFAVPVLVHSGEYVANTIVSGTYFVKEGGTGNGASWETAMGMVQFRNNLLNHPEGVAVTYHVAAGVYKPTADTIDRNATFNLKKGVKIYGGYPTSSTGIDLTGRNISKYPTIFSGDIDNNDLVDGEAVTASNIMKITNLNLTNNSANSYHVVTGGVGATNADTELNGVFVVGGQASAGITKGGGMLNDQSSPTISDCTFVGNAAKLYGGGISNTKSSPVIKNSTFVGNVVESQGGGVYNADNSVPIITNCTFNKNSANYGGGIRNSSNATIINSTFSENMAIGAGSIGGGIHTLTGGSVSPTITNCIFSNNTAETSNPQLNPVGTITYNVIHGGSAVTYNGIGNVFTDPFLQPLSNNGSAGAWTIALGKDSSAIAAGTAVGAPTTDQRGVSRGTGTGNNAPSAGAYEVQKYSASISSPNLVYGDMVTTKAIILTNLSGQAGTVASVISTHVDFDVSFSGGVASIKANKKVSVGTHVVTLRIVYTNNGVSTIAYTDLSVIIDKQNITAITGITANNKVYDGQTGAVLVTTGAGFTGIISGDHLTVGTATGTFVDKHKGNNKIVNITGLTLGGSSAGNYNLTINTTTTTANITPAILTYVSDVKVRVYGVANPSLTGSVTGFVTGDTQYNATTGTLVWTTTATSTSVVGSYPIIGSGLTANNGNYTFTQASGNSTALTITPAASTISLVANQTKVYDGKNNQMPTVASQTGDGAVTYTWYADSSGAIGNAIVAPKNVGTYWVVGMKAYTVNYAAATSAAVKYVITPKPVTITWSSPTTYIFDNSPKSITATIDTGVTNETLTVGTYTNSDTNVNTATNVGNYTASVATLANGTGTTTNYTLTGAMGNSQGWSINVIKQYHITVTPSSGGTITPSNETVVDEGMNHTLTFKADPGYEIATILINGSNIIPSNKQLFTHTLHNITQDYIIQAVFATVVINIPSTNTSGAPVYGPGFDFSEIVFPEVPTPPTITPPATCQPYILKEIKYQSPKNDPQEVIKLQNFL